MWGLWQRDTWDRVTRGWTLGRSEQNKCEAGQGQAEQTRSLMPSSLGRNGHQTWTLRHDTASAINTYSRRHAPQPSRCSGHSIDHPAFFNIHNFAEMTILFGANCENISMALHRTNLEDLTQTAKVVSGRKFIRNSGEEFFIRILTDEQGAIQVKPALTLVWVCTEPHSSLAIQLKRSKSSISVSMELFYQGFPHPNNLTVKQWALLHAARCWGLGTTQQRIL